MQTIDRKKERAKHASLMHMTFFMGAHLDNRIGRWWQPMGRHATGECPLASKCLQIKPVRAADALGHALEGGAVMAAVAQ